MKNDLTCGVVRDLLPSYIEGLLGEESREAVERHLETCPACAAEREAMVSPPEAVEAGETAKEVDYLKRVKKGTAKKIAVAVICTAVVLLGSAALKLFVIGTPLQVQTAHAEVVQQQTGYVQIQVSSMSSANAYHGWQVETADGVASIYAREVLASFWFNSGGGTVFVNLTDDHGEEIREIWLGGPKSGRLVWQEGLIIHPDTLRMLETKTPYCGDPSALGHIAELLQIESGLGPYAISLQTSSRPYIWTLEFQQSLDTKESRTLRYYMIQMLALVENLDKVAYTYHSVDLQGRTAEDRTHSGGISAEAAARVLARLTELHNEQSHTDWPVHESIKEYAESPLEYQRMVTLLKEHFLSQW